MSGRKHKKTTYPNHSFYWATPLSEERMGEIDGWVGSLTQEQETFLRLLLEDGYEKGRSDEADTHYE